MAIDQNRKEIPDIVSALKPIRYYNQLDSLDSKAKNTHFHVSVYKVSLLRDLWALTFNTKQVFDREPSGFLGMTFF